MDKSAEKGRKRRGPSKSRAAASIWTTYEIVLTVAAKKGWDKKVAPLCADVFDNVIQDLGGEIFSLTIKGDKE